MLTAFFSRCVLRSSRDLAGAAALVASNVSTSPITASTRTCTPIVLRIASVHSSLSHTHLNFKSAVRLAPPYPTTRTLLLIDPFPYSSSFLCNPLMKEHRSLIWHPQFILHVILLTKSVETLTSISVECSLSCLLSTFNLEFSIIAFVSFIWIIRLGTPIVVFSLSMFVLYHTIMVRYFVKNKEVTDNLNMLIWTLVT